MEHIFHNLQKYIPAYLGGIAFNVPAVCDVFLRPIKKNAKHFYGHKKMWRRKTAQMAQARLRFYGTLEPPNGGGTYTVLLCAGLPFFQDICYNPFCNSIFIIFSFPFSTAIPIPHFFITQSTTLPERQS
jgi:hypothetical protein